MVRPGENIRDDVLRKAMELGCSHMGFARPTVLHEEGARLEDWLQNEYHATMNFMASTREKRTDPSLVLPGVETVISLAWNYFHPAERASSPSVGKISRYAWGDDYHEILTEWVRELCGWIDSRIPGATSRGYVDTGPTMDKVWAQRAGLGWIGKNGNLITRDSGSWVFLGTVLTTAWFTADTPSRHYCGTCTACISACPTYAIVAPGVVDSRRCLSYLTIERRGEYSEEEENLSFDQWIFGCDLCQDVCPWNRFQRSTSHKVFHPRSVCINPDLEELLTLTQMDFSARFRHSPVKRAKHAGLLRNARTVLRQSESDTRVDYTPTESEPD